MKKCTVVLKSTSRCSVYCDGEHLTELNGAVQIMKVSPGEHLFEFILPTESYGLLCEDVVVDLAEGGRKVLYEEELQRTYELKNKYE